MSRNYRKVDRTIKFFSRHDPAEELKDAIKSVTFEDCIESCLWDSYASTTEWGEEVVDWTFSGVIEHDPTPFKDGYEILERISAWGTEGEIEGDYLPLYSKTLAGVFPADVIGDIISHVQSDENIGRINLITFKYERDRETNTVSRLSAAILWQIEAGEPLRMIEEKIGGAR